MSTLPASGQLDIAVVGRYHSMYSRLGFTLAIEPVFLLGGCGGGLYPGLGLLAQVWLSFVLGCGWEGPLASSRSCLFSDNFIP